MKHESTKKIVFNYKILCISMFLLFTFLFFQCEKSKKDIPAEIILAKVGDKTVSLNEFITRAEYTIRPRYCNGSGNIHKKIVLNSIIAEKMFAMEAGDSCKLAKNEHFLRFIEGRKQQAMRQWLYHKEGVEKVKLDDKEIKKIYQLVGRKYRINYFSVNNDTLAEIIKKKLDENRELFNPIYFEISSSDSIPEREVDYNIQENERIHNALFSKKLNVGDVIGPMRMTDGSYIIMKVNGWTDSPAIAESDVSRRWNDVKEELTNKEAKKIYEGYVAQVMRGKRMDFNPDTFSKLADIVAQQYFAAKEMEKEQFLNQTLGKKIENQPPEISKEINNILNESLFTVDGKVWTVQDFSEEIEIHPLVYRNKNVTKDQFASQFRLAIADMIRDRYLADEAYKKGYDKVDAVQRTTGMWRDASIALYYKNQYLKKMNSKEENPVALIEKCLNPYVDKLQQKYSEVIEVNVEEFDKLQLTHTDMFVTQSNVPFPVMVPSFPQITTDHKLDYGKRMK